MPRQKNIETVDKNNIKDIFIGLVGERPALWSLKDPGYKNQVFKQSLWEQILHLLVSEFGMDQIAKMHMDDVHGLKEQFGNLRCTFNKVKNNKKLKSGSGAKDTPKKWIWEDRMSFLNNGGAGLEELITYRVSSIQPGPPPDSAQVIAVETQVNIKKIQYA